MSDNRYRLPKTVVPSRYDLVLEPDFETFAFEGVVDVTLIIGEAVDEIVLNADELSFGSAWLEPAGGDQIEVTGVRLDPETERAHLSLARTATPGDATLHVEFTGTVNDRLRGFYRSTYTDDIGEHIIATTQMQPTDARRAFPCWDEPEFKAVFGLSLVVPEELKAFANGAKASSEPAGNGKRRVSFADTMPMSTYLIAFCVGRLEATEPVIMGGVPVRVVHVPGKGNLTSFALEVAEHSLRFFTDYYGIPYPEKKLDLAALPDFAAGAMENPGFITFREAALLVDPATATQVERLRIADTIAHEIAHMWFGDLVTMRWWNGTWLNEAFATFMSLLAVDAWKPEWKVFESFALDRSEAFEVDALSSTRSIEYEVIAPGDVEDMFDVLTYEKGGSTLWMLEQYLGREPFRDGIRRYLADHLYGNTETADLWDALAEVTGEPVGRVMDAWIWQGGHPLVNVARQGDQAALSQTRFGHAGADDGTRWPTPLRVRVGERTDALLVEPEGALVEAATGELVVANAGGSSFVRVHYEGELFEAIKDASAGLAPLERYVLLDDAWAAVLAGALGAVEFCELAARFGVEDESPVWKTLLGGLGWCDRLLDGEPREGFRSFVRDLAGPRLEAAGWEPREGESDLDRELRGTLVRAMGLLGRDAATIDRAVVVERASRAGEKIDGPLAAAALPVAATAGGEEEWEAFVAMYRDGRTPQQKRRYVQALASFPQPELMQRTLARTLDGYIRSQDLPLLVEGCLTSRDHGAAAWEFVKENWDALRSKLTPHLLVYLVEGVRVFSTQAQRDDVLAFFEAHPLERAQKMLVHALERQSVAVALREREADELAAAFAPGGRLGA